MPLLRIHTHWQVPQYHPSNQNLPKSMAAPTHGGQKNGQHTTKAIRNAGFRRLATVRPASEFSTGDTDAALQSCTAGMGTIVGCHAKN